MPWRGSGDGSALCRMHRFQEPWFVRFLGLSLWTVP